MPPKKKTTTAATTPPQDQATPVATLEPSAPTTGPAYGQGPFMAGVLHPMPFQWDIDLFALAYPEGYLFLRHEELTQEVRDLTDELTEAFAELKVLRAPADCHAEAKAQALILSIGNGRFIQDLFEALQTAMFDMAQRGDPDEKWVVNTKLTATLDKHNHNKSDITGEVKAVIPAVACSGSVYIDGAGNLLTPKEAVRQLSMFQYGRDEERKIAA